MYQVIKRDGRRVDFDLARIANAITKAFDAAKIPYNTAIIDLLALQVTADYAGKVRNNEIGVEDIQDSVEAVLQRAGYAAVAKSYILYRKNREKLREMHSTVLDYKKLVDDYLGVGLAGQGKLHRHLLCGRADPVQLRRYHRQLLAQRDLR